MSYTPTEWKTGDIVTSTKLNKLEQGVANAGPLMVNVTVTDNGDDTYTYTCDKTAGEMLTAASNGIVVLHTATDEGGVRVSWISEAGYDDEDEPHYFFTDYDFNMFTATELTDYPIRSSSK